VVEIPPSLPTTPLKSSRDTPPLTSRASDSPITGVEGLLYHLAGCCNPIPGEPIIGVVTRNSRGISIHRQGCSNLENVEGDRQLPVNWNPEVEHRGHVHTYRVNMQIEALDRVGLLKDILSRLSDQGINVSHAQVKTANNQPALIDLGIEIRDRTQLENIFNQIRKMSDVLDLRRVGETVES